MTPEELHIAHEIAKKFHEAYERLAPEYGYETRDASAVPWEDVPQQNKLLMVAVVGELLDKHVIFHTNLFARLEDLETRIIRLYNQIREDLMAEPKLEIEKRVDRIELAVSTIAEELGMEQVGKILAGEPLEGGEQDDTFESGTHYPAAERQEEPGPEVPPVRDEQN